MNGVTYTSPLFALSILVSRLKVYISFHGPINRFLEHFFSFLNSINKCSSVLDTLKALIQRMINQVWYSTSLLNFLSWSLHALLIAYVNEEFHFSTYMIYAAHISVTKCKQIKMKTMHYSVNPAVVIN